MQTSSPPVITPNRSQSNPDDMITLPRPIQSVGMDLHDISGTSTGQALPRERSAPPGTHFCPTILWVYPQSATIFILHPLLSTFSSTFVRNIKQQLQGSCARVRRIQTPGVITICGWSAAGRRPTPGLQQQLRGSCARVRRIQTPGVVTICGWSAAGRRPTPGLQ